MVAGGLQVAVADPPSQVRSAAAGQVHAQKGQFAVYVLPAQGGVKFDAVERHRLAIQPHDVAKVQVAVTFAHPAVDPAPRQQRAAAPVFGLGPGGEAIQSRAAAWTGAVAQGGEVVAGGLRKIGGAAVGRVHRRRRQALVKGRDALGERVDVRAFELAACEQAIERRLLREAPHFDCIVDGPAAAAQARGRGCAGDRQYGKIELRRQAAVQAQFFATEMPALTQAGEVQKAKIDRLLSL